MISIGSQTNLGFNFNWVTAQSKIYFPQKKVWKLKSKNKVDREYDIISNSEPCCFAWTYAQQSSDAGACPLCGIFFLIVCSWLSFINNEVLRYVKLTFETSKNWVCLEEI